MNAATTRVDFAIDDRLSGRWNHRAADHASRISRPSSAAHRRRRRPALADFVDVRALLAAADAAPGAPAVKFASQFLALTGPLARFDGTHETTS